MPWFWTDDLADLLIEHDGLRPESVTEWTARPSALAAPASVDALDFARALLENEAVA
ncbi:MAG: hypothetical protein RI637_05665 [Acidimicrobiia bacterium]|nr:hypothetical protein [Acidimicrobiia bacterium]